METIPTASVAWLITRAKMEKAKKCSQTLKTRETKQLSYGENHG
jgi:hypothetical protein